MEKRYKQDNEAIDNSMGRWLSKKLHMRGALVPVFRVYIFYHIGVLKYVDMI